MGEVKTMITELVGQIAGSKMEAPASTNGAGNNATSAPRRPAPPRPAGALDCPKCLAEGRAGFLLERAGANGKFLVCAEGREACGFLSDVPKNAKQRKAMAATKCAACGGVMRLRLPKDKGRKVSLACARYPGCQGVRWFDEKGVLEEATPLPAAGPACQLCGTPTVRRGPASSGNYFWSCPRWRSDGSGCNAKPVWINHASA
jgi:ssDNA-binding Zn-finger/Zn-ribbon topoisomerase 1